MSRLRFPGFHVDISRVERVSTRVDGNYTVEFDVGDVVVSPGVGKVIEAAWNRHHWESVAEMDQLLSEIDKNYEEIREHLMTDGPYLKGRMIYSYDLDGITIEKVEIK